MKAVVFLLRYSKLTALLSAAFGIVSGISSAALIVLVHNAVSDGRRTPRMMLAFAGLALTVAVGRVLSQYLLVRLTQNSMATILNQLCRQTLAAPLVRLEQIGQHRVLAALTQDVNVIVNGLTSIPMLLLHLSLFICAFIYLGVLSRVALAGVIMFIAICVLTFRVAMRRAASYLTRARQDVDELFRHFRSLTSGVKELKINRPKRNAFLTTLFDETAQSYRRNNLAANTIMATSGSVAHLQFFVLIGLMAFVVPAATGLDLRIVAGYTLVMLYMLGSVDFLSNALPALGRAGTAFKRLEELGLSLRSSVTERQVAIAPMRSWHRLALFEVTHTYFSEREGVEFVLGPVDVTVRRGEILFIVGGNGSGKTTLVKLLTALYTPASGTIYLDDIPITDENRDEYRQLFSPVFADFFLFDRFIGYEAEGVTERARTYLAQLELDHKVTIEGNRLSTIELSQGQRRRLALLSVYLEDRDIYVFDEWAADQDPSFKHVFYRQLLPELKARGKTVIVVTHDDRYYDVADTLVKLESGRVVEPLVTV